MRQAQASNLDLAVAAARVAEARAHVDIQRAAFFPQLSAQAQAQRAPSGQSGQSINGESYSQGNSFDLNFGASYELDLWGLAHDNVRAANEALKSSRFAQQSVALTVTANVANMYFSVLALRARIAIANRVYRRDQRDPGDHQAQGRCRQVLPSRYRAGASTSGIR
jgi:outer membrane protein TolC